MKKKVRIFAAIFLIAATALQAQQRNTVVTMTSSANLVSISVKYAGTGTIAANGITLNNGSKTTGIPVFNGKVTISATENIKLTELSCHSNQLTQLDLSKSTALLFLSCDNNLLTQLDLSKNIALTRLNCSYNRLTYLDVTKNTALAWLSCERNKLTQLYVNQNTALTWIGCESNYLTQLDVSKNTALEFLYCYNNKLTQLDVTKNTALTWLDCHSNLLSSLDISKNKKLTYLDAEKQAVKVAVLRDATTFPNPINYRNKTAVENAKLNGTAYAFGANTPLSAKKEKIPFTTNKTISEGNPFGGVITFVPDTQQPQLR